MKKTIIFIASLALAFACTKESPLNVTPTSGVENVSKYVVENYTGGTGTVNSIPEDFASADEYYEALREWKEDAWGERGLVKRSISYIFFADYGSMAFRFADIPDSMDVVNLWGGIPKMNSLDYWEMKACQEVKGMKVVGCRITRILENQKWGMQARIPSFMKAYQSYRDSRQGELDAIQEKIDEFDESDYDTEEEASEALTALKVSYNSKDAEIEGLAKTAGNSALRADVTSHTTKATSKWPDTDDNWPEWIVYGAGYLLNEVAEYGLNGYDLDYEPEGDPLSGTAFNTFVSYMAQYIGPKADPDYKEAFADHPLNESGSPIEYGDILIIDRNSGVGDASLAKYCNFWIYQKYGPTGGASPASASDFPSNLNPDNGWVPCQVITTENVGDTWAGGCNNLEQMARFQPSTIGRDYGHKGGFASFHGQRDWRIQAEGAEDGKILRYAHHRRGIAAQAAETRYSKTQK